MALIPVTTLVALLAYFGMNGNGSDEDEGDVRAALTALAPGSIVATNILKEHEAVKKSWIASSVSALASVFTSPFKQPEAATLDAYARSTYTTESELIVLDEESFLNTFHGLTLSLKARVVLYEKYMTKKVSTDATTRAASNAWRRVRTQCGTHFKKLFLLFFPLSSPNIYCRLHNGASV